MNNYTNLLIETIKLEIKKNEFLISFTKKKLNSNKEEIEIYKNNIDKINIKINDLKNGDFVSHNVLPNDHTNTLLNTYIHRELNWFGSSSYNHIEEATKSISKQYNISLYDSLRILNISNLNVIFELNECPSSHLNLNGSYFYKEIGSNEEMLRGVFLSHYYFGNIEFQD